MLGHYSTGLFIEFAFGALFVAMHAYGRYNTPQSNRCSTTRLRFVACFALYAAALLSVYWLITVIAQIAPEIYDKVVSNLGQIPGNGTSGAAQVSPEFFDRLISALGEGTSGGSSGVTQTTPETFQKAIEALEREVGDSLSVTTPVSSEFVGNASVNYIPSGAESIEEKRELYRSPITTALIFTTLLPNFPMLKKVDQRLLQIFWDLAEIPGHAVKLAHRMYRAPYYIFPTKHEDIERKARSFDIQLNEDDLKDRRSPAFTWAAIYSLLLEIKGWHSDDKPRYQRFILSRESDYEALRMHFATLSARLAAYYRRVHEMDGKLQQIEHDFRETLISDSRDLFMKLCRLAANAVLDSETGVNARHQAIEELGFELADDGRENLNASQLLNLIALMMLTFMGLSLTLTQFATKGETIGEVVFLGFLMAANYGASAFIGIYPKEHWRFADIEATHRRPWAGYLASGLLAVAASLLVISALRFTRYTFEGGTYDEAFEELLRNLFWSYPYLFLSFAMGFGVAFVCDIDWQKWSTIQQRIADGTLLAVIMILAGCITFMAMYGLFIFEGNATKSPPQGQPPGTPPVYSLLDVFELLSQCLAAGLLNGLLVPHWFRTSRYSSPTQRISRFIDNHRQALRIEAGKLQRDELRSALVTAAAATAIADGLVDDTEREVFRNTLGKLAEHNILDFQIETGMEDMLNQTDLWRSGDADHRQKEVLKVLAPLRRKDKLSRLTIQLTVAIAYADGVFQESERKAVEKIVSALHRNVEKELATCGV
ncbi:tellurite resistance TerB family protein [Marinobacter salinisoli]|uniref:Tellurite resistance TerB family protein n=1 Tax=Marinobacter salinisoli TaxID=2769486 RepID=A0ABX7MR77_9GAMM|nr:TerB family tellurite resistance protein [Marinobacter salinisoli]QSP94801.1 tellurite resistance TerB family protein [Marinobacter salinisoli]